jgi:hypothetical protein
VLGDAAIAITTLRLPAVLSYVGRGMPLQDNACPACSAPRFVVLSVFFLNAKEILIYR